jgi:GNAT superfamily N-acetyltransferase
MRLRVMRRADWPAVSELIYISTNYWYEANGKGPIFKGGPAVAELFCKVYEDLDPGCCILAEEPKTKRLMGSCFYHPRESHVALGIMNVNPAYFGRGVARELLNHIIAFSEKQKKPLRLVSSAMNLDSFSLYTRAGFVPQMAFQDMFIAVPKEGLKKKHAGTQHVRAATLKDVEKIVALEDDLLGIRRAKDYRYFIQNAAKIWHVSVYEKNGVIEGVLASVAHPGSNMLGPGVARNGSISAALILEELKHHRGRSPVFLVPVKEGALVQQLYDWGAKNCEVHFAQLRGSASAWNGVPMPSFMPETM